MMLPQGRPMTAPEAGPPVRKPRAWALPTTVLEAAPTMTARAQASPTWARVARPVATRPTTDSLQAREAGLQVRRPKSGRPGS